MADLIKIPFERFDGPAPFAPVVQRIADRLAYARDGLNSSINWNGELCLKGGTASSFSIEVGAINAVGLSSLSQRISVLRRKGYEFDQQVFVTATGSRVAAYKLRKAPGAKS